MHVCHALQSPALLLQKDTSAAALVDSAVESPLLPCNTYAHYPKQTQLFPTLVPKGCSGATL